MASNHDYFTRRAAQERTAASRASGKAREAHEDMADHYAELIGSTRTPDLESESDH